MEKGLIGVQMSTVKNIIGTLGAYGTLEACAKLGYHCVEISQIPMTAENVKEMRRACQDYGIKVAACSAVLEPEGRPGADNLVENFDKLVSDCKELDCDMLRLGILPERYRGGYEQGVEFAKRADEMAEKLREHGIDLYYHNHHVEFRKFNGQYLLDIIKEHSKYMGFELDIHWIHRGGEIPVNIIRQYAGRIRLLHLKDYRIGEQKPLDGPFDIVAYRKAFHNTIEFAEIGEGTMPIKECIQAGLDGGSEYFLIEQDDTYGRDPLESLKISHDNLVRMGYGDWF